MKRNKTATYTGSDIPCNFPYVTVQLTIYNEEKVVDRLIAHVSKLNYPRNSLQIQILDDSTDITSEIALQKVHDLILQGIDVEYIHRKNRSGYKAGALKNGLDSAKGELILILDSDFICPESLLLNLVGHFSDSRLGMVQARWGHINKDYSLLTKIQAILLDGHFIIEQAVRATHGLFFNFNGSGGIWRKSCILDAGGWQCDT
jgi:cellulose synthase/poly-beta-1,6-N-acetylglucosamine synthase-like glycosyltransferase